MKVLYWVGEGRGKRGKADGHEVSWSWTYLKRKKHFLSGSLLKSRRHKRGRKRRKKESRGRTQQLNVGSDDKKTVIKLHERKKEKTKSKKKKKKKTKQKKTQNKRM